MSPKIALIGPGRVGCAISKRLYEAGYPFMAIISRSLNRATEACSYIGCSTALASTELTDVATAEIILLAVPDDQVQRLAVQIQTINNFPKPATLVHFSGLHPADIMYQPASPHRLLSLHPLLPFANRQKGYVALSGCPCGLESDTPEAIGLGEKLVGAFGGHPFTVDHDKKPLYHAAACIASNYLVTLFASASKLLVKCGIEPDMTTSLLLPLVQATVKNIEELGPEQGLTGPVVRGDIGTVTQHLQTLQDHDAELLQLYRQLGTITAEIGKSSGCLDPKIAAAMQSLFSAKMKEQHGNKVNTDLSEINN